MDYIQLCPGIFGSVLGFQSSGEGRSVLLSLAIGKLDLSL